MAIESSALIAEVRSLTAEVGQRKASIRRHREQLGIAKARLVALEADCRRRGIGFAVVPSEDARASPRP